MDVFTLYIAVSCVAIIMFFVYVFRKRVTLNSLRLDSDERIIFEERPVNLQWMYGEKYGRYRRRPIIRVTNKRIIFAERKLTKDDARIIVVFVFEAGKELQQNHSKNGFFTFLIDQSSVRISQNREGQWLVDIGTIPTYGAWTKNKVSPCIMRVTTDDSTEYKKMLIKS